jgi:hypothetical protein
MNCMSASINPRYAEGSTKNFQVNFIKTKLNTK